MLHLANICIRYKVEHFTDNMNIWLAVFLYNTVINRLGEISEDAIGN